MDASSPACRPSSSLQLAAPSAARCSAACSSDLSSHSLASASCPSLSAALTLRRVSEAAFCSCERAASCARGACATRPCNRTRAGALWPKSSFAKEVVGCRNPKGLWGCAPSTHRHTPAVRRPHALPRRARAQQPERPDGGWSPPGRAAAGPRCAAAPWRRRRRTAGPGSPARARGPRPDITAHGYRTSCQDHQAQLYTVRCAAARPGPPPTCISLSSCTRRAQTATSCSAARIRAAASRRSSRSAASAACTASHRPSSSCVHNGTSGDGTRVRVLQT